MIRQRRQHGLLGLRRPKFDSSLGQVGAFPLFVLFGLNLVDEFDRGAFWTLVPEIRDALNMSDATMVTIATAANTLALLLSVPIGYAADRWNRVGITVLGAALWGLGAVVTGMAYAVLPLAAARFIAGSGRIVNDAVHPSLLADYYPPQGLPHVNAIHRLATEVGAILAGPLAAFLASLVGWRPTFLLVSVPTVLLTIFAARLPHPPAGRPADDMKRSRVPLARAFRMLARIRTLSWIWVVSLLFGAAQIPLMVSLLSLFFDREHGLGLAERGFINTLFAVVGMVALLLGRWWAKRSSAVEDPPRLMVQTASFLTLFAAGVIALSTLRSLPLAVAATLGIAIGIGFMPSYFTLVALLTPQEVRSQAYAYALFFAALGGLMSSYLISSVVAAHGVRTGVLVLGVVGLTAGAIGFTVPRFVAADVDMARAG
ncbi:MAG: MFS transporter [Actinomycetota bacterium]|nr:MFS transporter [Actinomycetota bacterium]